MEENELKGVSDIPIKIIYVVNITIETICAHLPTRRLHCCCSTRSSRSRACRLKATHLCSRCSTEPRRRFSFVSWVSPRALCTIAVIVIIARWSKYYSFNTQHAVPRSAQLSSVWGEDNDGGVAENWTDCEDSWRIYNSQPAPRSRRCSTDGTTSRPIGTNSVGYYLCLRRRRLKVYSI